MDKPKKDNPAHEIIDMAPERGRILILCHNNPDPDTIAAATALKSLFFQITRHKATIGYGGIVGRAENRQMIKRLNIELIPINDLAFDDFALICLVDSQPRTGNNAIPSNILPDVVIDHHPLRRETQSCRFYDVRPNYGSSSTILTEYLREFGLTVDKKTATALFYGLKTDTNGLSRSSQKADLDAFNYLYPLMSQRTLAAIENPAVPKSYYQKISEAMENSIIYGDTVVSNMGRLNNPDLAAEMADFLLRMEGVRWTFCLGQFKDDLIISLRTSRRGWWAGRVALRILKGVGFGGGHEKAAGGRVDIKGKTPEERKQIIDLLTDRFLKVVRAKKEEPKPLIPEPSKAAVEACKA